LFARFPEIPPEHALQGFAGVRAYTRDADDSRLFLKALAFEDEGDGRWEARGERRGSYYVYDESGEPGFGGAGTVHHVAWASPPEEHEAWRERVIAAGGRPTPVIDRFY